MRLKFLHVFVVLFCTTFLVTSCQKEESFENGDPNTGGPGGPGNPGGPGGGNGGGGNSTNNIAGDYDYVGLHATTMSSITMTVGGETMKTVTTSDYHTENNVGTAKITATEVSSNGVGYTLNTTATAKTYINGVFQDEMTVPFSFNLPPQPASSANYTRISSDSIVISANFNGPSPGGGSGGPTPPAGPYGYKLSWSGDTLLLKLTTTFSQTIDQGGVPATMVNSATAITKLKKK